MDNFSMPFSETTTNRTTTTSTPTFSFSSSSASLAQQQSMGHPQNVHYFLDNNRSLVFPTAPHFVPYDPNLQFPYMHAFPPVNQPHAYPLYSFPMGQSSVPFRMLNPQLQPREEDKKMMEAWKCKIARDKRKQVIKQRSRSSASGARSVLVESIRGQPVITSQESNVKETDTQYTSPHVFHAPDGKRLEEILTKKLRNSDVSSLGRIVIPKREAEEKFPTLWDKEGIELVLKDVYSNQRWSLKFKYWINNKSRMYVLENTGDFVNHCQLQMGDSVTFYEDEFKNMYVLTKREQNLEASEPASSKEGPQTDDTYNYDTSLDLLMKEPSHKREEETSNRFLTLCAGGASSSEGASNQVVGQATKESATSSSFKDHATSTNYIGQQNVLDDVYESLDNILEVDQFSSF